MRARVIFNPSADHGRASDLKEKILAGCREYAVVDLIATERAGHAAVLAREAADDGFEIVVAAGGDGTIHEIVNGLVNQDESRVKLGLIPIGSGNDFAYGLGLYTDLATAIKRIFTGSPRFIDLARIEDGHGRQELVVNGIGIGFDATVSIQSSTITRVHGFALYALAALRTIALYYQTPQLKIQFDDETIEQKALMLTIGVGPRIGGGFHLTPDALFDDGLLDSCTVNPINRPTMLRLLPKAMHGTHVTSHNVTMRRSREIKIQSNIALPIHLDGEIFAYPEDNVRQVTITTLPAALQVINSSE
jgi:YegS/Rv2252/BmrU family lipid kinase